MKATKKRMFIPTAGKLEYGTPPELVDRLARRWAGGGFDLDPAASETFHVVENYFTSENDGLSKPWHGRVFLNPPYGKAEESWVAKAVQEVMAGHAEVVVALLPAKTGKNWWTRYIVADVGRPGIIDLKYPVRDVWFMPGRVAFLGANSHANFSSVVVVFEKYQVSLHGRKPSEGSKQLSLL